MSRGPTGKGAPGGDGTKDEGANKLQVLGEEFAQAIIFRRDEINTEELGDFKL